MRRTVSFEPTSEQAVVLIVFLDRSCVALLRINNVKIALRMRIGNTKIFFVARHPSIRKLN